LRRLVPWIALAAAAVLPGCSTLTGEPEASSTSVLGARAAALAKAEEHFKGRWYVLDKNMSCLPEKIVTFADGKATYEIYPGTDEGEGTDLDWPAGGASSAAGADPGTRTAAAAPAIPEPLVLPYHIESDAKTGLDSLVVKRPDGEDRYWRAGPDFLLALNADGYDVMAHCD
jgi:hypothetical protein